ncbi:MAG: diguanylate cyclase [Halothiobacillus sp.]|nr:diguanylate cyclase [Halothiobacillus sp.]
MKIVGAPKSSQRNESEVAILFVDPDDLKLVNDTQGHLIGDELLCQVATRLHKSTRESDLLA